MVNGRENIPQGDAQARALLLSRLLVAKSVVFDTVFWDAVVGKTPGKARRSKVSMHVAQKFGWPAWERTRCEQRLLQKNLQRKNLCRVDTWWSCSPQPWLAKGCAKSCA